MTIKKLSPAALGLVAVFGLIINLPTSVRAATLSEGMVSLNFDDNYRETYNKVLPVLNEKDFKATFYIVTDRLAGVASVGISELLSLQSAGHEIGAHSRTHSSLANADDATLESEIKGSRQDLLDKGINKVLSYAYTFGEFNDRLKEAVKQAGFSNARTTQAALNLPGEDSLLLHARSIRSNTPLDTIKSEIDAAIAQKGWVAFNFHELDTGREYSISTERFKEIVSYIQSKGVKVVTMSEGAKILSSNGNNNNDNGKVKEEKKDDKDNKISKNKSDKHGKKWAKH